MELGELIGVKGKTDEQTFENWIKACEQLKKDIDIPETILAWLLEAHPKECRGVGSRVPSRCGPDGGVGIPRCLHRLQPRIPHHWRAERLLPEASMARRSTPRSTVISGKWKSACPLKPTPLSHGPQRRFGRRQNWWLQLTATCLTRFALLSPFRGSVLRHRPAHKSCEAYIHFRVPDIHGTGALIGKIRLKHCSQSTIAKRAHKTKPTKSGRKTKVCLKSMA